MTGSVFIAIDMEGNTMRDKPLAPDRQFDYA